MTPTRTVLYGLLAAVVVVVAAWMFLVYRPRGDELADLDEQITQAEDLEQSLSSQVARLRRLDEERPSVEAELRQLTAAVPPDPELATLILSLHEEATRSGIDFLQFTPTPPTDGGETAVISAGLNVSGSFFTVLEFLDRIEALNRIIVVDSLELTASEPEQPEQPAQPEQPQEESGEAGVSGSPEGEDDSTVDASQLVTIATEFGEVTTDSASVNGQNDQEGEQEGEQEGDGRAGAALVSPQPLRFPVGAFEIQMQLRVRTFTTARPPGLAEDDGTTTTTAPPADGEGAATTPPAEDGG